MRSHLAVCALAALAPASLSQFPCQLPGVSVSVTPQVAQVGETIQVSLQNGSPNVILQATTCVILAINQGGCHGALVWDPAGCFFVLTSIPPGTSKAQSWDQTDDFGQQVPPGTYWIEVLYATPFLQSRICCATVTILSSYQKYGSGCPGSQGMPTLDGSGTPSAGSPITLSGAGGPQIAPALLAFGYGTGTLPVNATCSLAIAPLTGFVAPLTLDATGAFSLGVSVPPGLPPTTITAQYVAVDALFPPSFLAASNALAIQTL